MQGDKLAVQSDNIPVTFWEEQGVAWCFDPEIESQLLLILI